MNPSTVVMYHTVQETAIARFPRRKGMSSDDFVAQVARLKAQFLLPSLDQWLGWLAGEFEFEREPCLLTFDDGLLEHATIVSPILAEENIAALFFIISACASGEEMVAVHQNHALMAELPESEYEIRVRRHWDDQAGSPWPEPSPEHPVATTYRWDSPEVAAFKYSINFLLPPDKKDKVIEAAFAEVFGHPEALIQEWYADRNQLLEMQEANQILGGHTHRHQALATLAEADMRSDLETNWNWLQANLRPQPLWPFCYPYGKPHTIHPRAPNVLADLGYACAFTTTVDHARPGTDPFQIPRFDCKDV